MRLIVCALMSVLVAVPVLAADGIQEGKDVTCKKGEEVFSGRLIRSSRELEGVSVITSQGKEAKLPMQELKQIEATGQKIKVTSSRLRGNSCDEYRFVKQDGGTIDGCLETVPSFGIDTGAGGIKNVWLDGLAYIRTAEAAPAPVAAPPLQPAVAAAAAKPAAGAAETVAVAAAVGAGAAAVEAPKAEIAPPAPKEKPPVPEPAVERPGDSVIAGQGMGIRSYTTSLGDMTLRFEGNSISGTYAYRNGKIEGKLAGNVMVGSWQQDNAVGLCVATFSDDFRSVSIQWTNACETRWRGNWSGTLK